MAFAATIAALILAAFGCKKVETDKPTDFQEVKKGLTSLPSATDTEIPIRLYFYDSQAALLVPVTRFVSKERVYPAVIFEEMLKGPAPGMKLARTIPEAALLLGIELGDGVLTIDLSEEIRGYGGGSVTEIGLVNSILYASRQIEGAEFVQILIDGIVVEYLPEGTDISHPIPIPVFDNNYDPGEDGRKFTAFLPLRGAPLMVPAAIAATTPNELYEKLNRKFTYGGLFDAGLTEIEFSIERSKSRSDAIEVGIDDSLLKLEKERIEAVVRSLACTVYNFTLARPDYSAYAFFYAGDEVVMLKGIDLTAEGCAAFISEINLEVSDDS